MHILAFSTSPRYGGNSERLLDSVVSGLVAEGVSVGKYRLHEMKFVPCKGCGVCDREFRCPIGDEFQHLIEPLISCDGIVFASPLYFMNVPARGKAFIDRCQVFWSAKYHLGMDLFGSRRRLGLLVSCGGASAGPGGVPLFRGIEDTMTYFFDALGLEMMKSFLVSRVDRNEIITDKPDAVRNAREMGRRMAICLKDPAHECT
ncbi:flavodoxin family protein [bacterium]|nr:flavodoxin family protein [bacterium]